MSLVKSFKDSSKNVDKEYESQNERVLNEYAWVIINAYFKDNHLKRLVRHHLESYNNFINFQLYKTIQMFDPITIASEQDYDLVHKKHSLKVVISFDNFSISRPQIHENNGAIKLMFPSEARLRNFTYASMMTLDMNIKYHIYSGASLDIETVQHKKIPNIHIGKMPIMLGSNICVLSNYNHLDNVSTGECRFDAGGYFIINGSEKTVLAQERAAENRVYCFNVSKNNTKYSWIAEIKSVPDYKCISPKQISIMVAGKNNGLGYSLKIQIPRMKQPIPLFVVFRALGILSDKEICEKILLNVSENTHLDFLEGSVLDSNKYQTQEDAITYFVSHVMYSPINMDKETGALKKMEFAMDVLSNDLFPHCKTVETKIWFLGYMTNKLIQAFHGERPEDNRDSYFNKRVDSTGTLINNLFRNYFNKVVKDMEKQVIREINTGSWKSTDDYGNIINHTNIYKIIKSATIENGIKKALATGDFGIKQVNSNKVGVAQVLNRLTFISSLSHLRRVSTPIEKSGKMVPPRQLNGTSWGFLCPAETPEGQSVGVVKNLSFMTHISIFSCSNPLYDLINPMIILFQHCSLAELADHVKVFVNGSWIGVSKTPHELYLRLRGFKRTGMLNIYTSIIFDYRNQEIRICNDSGRVLRPLLIVENKRVNMTVHIIEQLKSGGLIWDDLFTNCKLETSVLEYVDAEEQNYCMIATSIDELRSNVYNYTHVEIHPSTLFGILASCIPFPEHNQSPRNTYQCAMGKQAMGVYVTNFYERMDKTAYVLTYPSRPLVDTRVMNILKLNDLPSGINITVAIMTYTGYNQEDSLLVNKGSIDRGLFQATIYHTEKDEDKQKINGDEEIRCKPNPSKTRSMKFANYDKVDENGVIPENSLIENRDVIISKVIPIKDNKNDITKVIKFEDQSKMYKTTEESYVDKNYLAKNADGYGLAKVRIRALRTPIIGDKFCALGTQQVLTDKGWIQIQDIDITIHRLCTLSASGELLYEPPSHKFEYSHDEDMIIIDHPAIHIICTNNHRLYVQRKQEKAYELIECEQVIDETLLFAKTMKNIHPDIASVTFDGITIQMSSWLMFVSSVVGIRVMDVAVTNIWLKGMSSHIYWLDNAGIRYKLENGDIIISGVKYPELFAELSSMTKTSRVPLFPEIVWSLSRTQCRFLLALLHTNSNIYLFSPTLGFANEIVRLALHCDWSGNILSDNTGYKIQICKVFNFPTVKMGECVTRKHYQGKVYCVEMPSSHTYYMRENEYGPCVIIGNSSRHGQKGTIGNVVPEADMPYTADGIRPDIIINPHAIPSRMTIGQLKETLLGKVLVLLGLFGDGTSFGKLSVSEISKKLSELGYEKNGNEIMYNGHTGEQLSADIFIGPVFYQRLKHMVRDKQHSRSFGPMVNLTRQPAEGRSRDGGLRFGEMERDCSISHGAARFTKERTYDVSDKYHVHVCKKCGMIASYNDKHHIHLCKNCDNRTDFSRVNIPFACKLITQELQTMNVSTRFMT